MGRFLLVIAEAIHLITGREPSCRLEPSCSRYAWESVERFGPLRGLWLTVKRVMRCRPGGSVGWDPVPGGEL